jgi:Tfp pilus assembly protein PilN
VSARVNLLPREIEERARTRRTASLTVGAVFVFLALLGLLYIVKLGSVNEARSDRDAAQAEVNERRAELAALERYAELDRQVKARNDLLAAAMSTEISWARVFNDLALTFPASSSLTTLTATAEGAGDTGESGQATAQPGDKSIAALEFNGYSVERYAPGVERVLLKFSDVSMFFNSYLSEASAENPARNDTTLFDGRLNLNDEARTGRYVDGLPREVGQ